MIVAIGFPMGEILLGVFAMFIHDFRYLLRVLYAPGVFFIIYLWLVPESIQWLLVRGRVERAIKILQRTASMNGKVLSQKSIEMIKLKYSMDTKGMEATASEKTQQQHQQNRHSITANAMAAPTTHEIEIENENGNIDKTKVHPIVNEKSTANPSIIHSLSAILKSPRLCVRFLICCYYFVSSSFCYYGMNFSALKIVGISGYVGFIMVVAFEIPAVVIAVPLLKFMKRRQLMFVSLFLTSILTIVTPLLPQYNSTVVLVAFMLAKTSISFTYNMVYVYVAEQVRAIKEN